MHCKAYKIAACDDTGFPVCILASGLCYLDALLCLPILANDFAINTANNVFYIVSIYPDY